MSEISDYGMTFRYHSTTEYVDFLEYPDPSHIGGVDGKTDFGTGLYLSNDLAGSLAWGARRSNPPEGTLNVYDIEPGLFSTPGIYLSDSTEDIMIWACTTALNLMLKLDGIENQYFGILASKYCINNDNSEYNWILSRRTDDSMYSYLKDFFVLGLTFEGLIYAYYDLSFGDELVIKTSQGMQYIRLNEEESEHYIKQPYLNQYDNFKNSKMELFSRIKYQYSVRDSNGLDISQICDMIEQGIDWTTYVSR